MLQLNRGTIAWVLTCIIWVNGQAQNGPYSLKQCVETALNNNIPVKQNELLVESAKADLNKAKANLLPDLNGNWGYGGNQGRAIDPFTNNYIDQRFASSGVGLNAGLTLFSGLQLQNLIRQTRYARDASEMEWQQSKDKLTLEVMLAYLTVLNSEDTWRIMQEQTEVTRSQVERLTVLVEKGATGSFMLSDMKGQLSANELAAIDNHNLLQSAKLTLCQLMN
ncbi:MAG TPA: TolC family protein, partial [Agriterribacter sp.]|nr:TolC family protein [Agriterribacter sp.]